MTDTSSRYHINIEGSVENSVIIVGNNNTANNFSARTHLASSVVNSSRPQAHHWQGREVELFQLSQWVDEPAIKLISIVSAGGYGKSTLASKLYETTEEFDDKFWACFNQPLRFWQWSRWILMQVGQEFEEDLPEELLGTALVNYLSTGRYLLVLDNIETLLEEEAYWLPYSQFLLSLCESCSNSKVILTSRIKTDGFELYSEELMLKGLSESASIALLRAMKVKGAEVELQKFSMLVDGHPLLIRLSVSWLRKKRGHLANVSYVLNKTDINLLDTIVGPHKGNPAVSVSKVIEQSVEGLPSNLRELWQALSVYRLPFNSLQAEVINPDAREVMNTDARLEDLRELARYALLQEEPTSDSWEFSFLPLVKKCAQQQASDLATAHERAIVYFTVVARPEPWENIEELSDYFELFYHHTELGQYGEAFNAIHGAICDYLSRQGRYSLILDYYQKLLPIWVTGENEGPYGAVLQTIGDAYRNLGAEEMAMTYFIKALDTIERTGDEEDLASVLVNMGRTFDSMGEPEKAIAHNKRGLAIAKRLSNLTVQAYALNNLGIAFMDLERYEEAIDFFNQSILLRNASGCPEENDGATINIGLVYSYMGKYPQAVESLQHGLELTQDSGNILSSAYAQSNLGNVFISMDDLDQGVTYHQRALAIFQELGLENQISGALKLLEKVCVDADKPLLASEYRKQLEEMTAS